MRSTASFAGHPVHPMLVPFPIALWVFSLIADIIVLLKFDPVWSSIAYFTMAGGTIGALLAALPGFVDLFTLPPSRTRKIGIWHMSINFSIVVLYVVNLLWRRHVVPDALGPFLLSVFAVLLLMVSGWLGGEMVYVHGVAVEPVEGEKPGGPNVSSGR